MEQQERASILYEFLLQNESKNYISKREIALALPMCYKIENNTSRYGRDIENDVSFLNSSECEKIVVSNNYGYKIGNEAEVNEYIKKLYNRDLKSLWRLSHLRKKVLHNNNMQFDIDDTLRVVETFKEAK